MYQPYPNAQQGWFLGYLFFYSQLLTHLFIEVHPNHQVYCHDIFYFQPMKFQDKSQKKMCFRKEYDQSVMQTQLSQPFLYNFFARLM